VKRMDLAPGATTAHVLLAWAADERPTWLGVPLTDAQFAVLMGGKADLAGPVPRVLSWGVLGAPAWAGPQPRTPRIGDAMLYSPDGDAHLLGVVDDLNDAAYDVDTAPSVAVNGRECTLWLLVPRGADVYYECAWIEGVRAWVQDGPVADYLLGVLGQDAQITQQSSAPDSQAPQPGGAA
jgi:hypothetical protein